MTGVAKRPSVGNVPERWTGRCLIPASDLVIAQQGRQRNDVIRIQHDALSVSGMSKAQETLVAIAAKTASRHARYSGLFLIAAWRAVFPPFQAPFAGPRSRGFLTIR